LPCSFSFSSALRLARFPTTTDENASRYCTASDTGFKDNPRRMIRLKEATKHGIHID
jgi:hypothetical protein